MDAGSPLSGLFRGSPDHFGEHVGEPASAISSAWPSAFRRLRGRSAQHDAQDQRVIADMLDLRVEVQPAEPATPSKAECLAVHERASIPEGPERQSGTAQASPADYDIAAVDHQTQPRFRGIGQEVAEQHARLELDARIQPPDTGHQSLSRDESSLPPPVIPQCSFPVPCSEHEVTQPVRDVAAARELPKLVDGHAERGPETPVVFAQGISERVGIAGE